MEPNVQIAAIICGTIIVLAGMVVLMAWIGSKNNRKENEQ